MINPGPEAPGARSAAPAHRTLNRILTSLGHEAPGARSAAPANRTLNKILINLAPKRREPDLLL